MSPVRRSTRRITRARSSTLGIAACVALAGCTGSGGSSSSPSSLDLTLRSITSCPASVTVPSDVSTVVPDVTSPPTSVLKTGDALAFSAPRGSKIGAVGSSDRSQRNIICESSRESGAQRLAIILGRNPGFTQVALMVPGKQAVRRILVTVTG